MSELAESDLDLNGADCEDNVTLEYRSEQSASLDMEHGNESEEEFNLNMSFTGGYMPNTDLTRVDKGLGNPQFAGIHIKS